MDNRERTNLWINLNRLAFIAVILLALKLFTYFFESFLPVFSKVFSTVFFAFLPFILALIVAFLLEPLVTWLMRVLRLRRIYASLLTLLLTLAMFGLFVFLITSRLYTELADLALNLPDYNSIVNLLTSKLETMQDLFTLHPQIKNALFNSTEEIFKSLQAWAKSASVVLLAIVSALPSVFVVIVVSIVATILMSASYPQVKRVLTNVLPKRWHSSAQVLSQDLGSAAVGYLRAQLILVSITAFGVIIGLLIIGNPYAVTVGVVAGILDIIPILGPGILFVPWGITLLVLGQVSMGVKVLILYAVVTAVRQVLEPKILSQSIGLHPLPTLIAMYVGLQLLGTVGIIIGPVLLIVYEAMRKAGILKFGK